MYFLHYTIFSLSVKTEIKKFTSFELPQETTDENRGHFLLLPLRIGFICNTMGISVKNGR